MSPFWISSELRCVDGGSGDNWSYNTRKLKFQSDHHHPAFYRPDAFPVAQPFQSTEEIIIANNRRKFSNRQLKRANYN